MKLGERLFYRKREDEDWLGVTHSYDGLDVYVELQDEFFKVLAEENGISAETLTTDFENYSMNAIEKSPNCDLKFLCDSAKAYYIDEYIERYYKKGYLSIRECQQKAKELNEIYSFDKEKVCGALADL